MKQIVLLLMMCFPTLLWGNEVVQMVFLIL